MPNWAEQVTAVATVVSAVGWLSAVGAALFAAQQVREARHTRQAQVGADFVRRWDEAPMVETRRLVAGFRTKEELKAAFLNYVESNAAEAYVLYRELDYFEQLGALERVGAVNFELVRLLLGRRLIERWEMWKPSVDALGEDVYPMFAGLVAKMRTELAA
ncbi:MAG TPA: hypothetical protein VKI01_13915 [Acidimicrobiia bacterium]|nr:hypothetical protein [Acidimicrobiia bacterium]